MTINWKIIKKKTIELKFYQHNPYLIKDDALDTLDYSFNKIGFCSVLIINTDNVVLSGNTRLQILLKNKVEEVDCYVPNKKLSEIEEKNIVLLLNGACSGNRVDFEILHNYFDGIEGIDLIKCNYSYKWPPDKIYDIDKREASKLKIEKIFNYNLLIECKDEKEQQEKYEELSKMGYNVKIETI